MTSVETPSNQPIVIDSASDDKEESAGFKRPREQEQVDKSQNFSHERMRGAFEIALRIIMKANDDGQLAYMNYGPILNPWFGHLIDEMNLEYYDMSDLKSSKFPCDYDEKLKALNELKGHNRVIKALMDDSDDSDDSDAPSPDYEKLQKIIF